MKRLAVSTAIAALLSALAALPVTADPIEPGTGRTAIARPDRLEAAWDANITGDGVVIASRMNR